MAENRAREIRQMILDEMDTAIENAKNAEVKTGQAADKRYSLSQQEKLDLRDRLDLVLRGQAFENDAVLLRETPTFFVERFALNEYPMVMSANHAYVDMVSREYAAQHGKIEKANYHNLGKYGFIMAIDHLDEPLAVIKSRIEEANTDLVALTDTVDKNGDPVIAAIRINKPRNVDGRKQNTNDIGSVYGKNGFFRDFIDNAFKANRILYLNKEKARNENAPGVQFPDRILNSDFNSNLEHYLRTVKKNSIPSSEVYSINVDSEGRELSDAQQAYFKDSEVRDDDGRLLRVYHGTSEKFTVFDMDKGKIKMDIQGVF